MDSQDYDAQNFGSVAGIMTITFGVVEVLKKVIKPTTPFLGKIPAVLLPFIVAVGLAVMANKLMTLDNGSPALSGNLWVIVGRALQAALGSTGITGVLQQGGTSLGDSTPLSNQPPPAQKKK